MVCPKIFKKEIIEKNNLQFEFKFDECGDRADSLVIYCSDDNLMLYVNMLDNLKNGFTFTNNTRVSGNYLEEYIEDTDKWTTIIYNKEVKLNKELPKTGY